MVLPVPPDRPGPLLSADDPEVVRLDELRAYGVLDTAPEQALDELTRLAAQLFRVPVALVSLVDEHRQWFKSRVGLDMTETPREQAFCAHAIRGSEVMVVEDAHADPRFQATPLVTDAPGIRFYAGVPIRTSGGVALGTLCAIDDKPRRPGPDDIQALQDLADLVSKEVQLRETLALARDQLDRSQAVLLASEEWAKARGLPVLAYLRDGEAAAVDFVQGAEGLLMAPVYAVPRLLARNGLSLQDFDYYEIHEAFAAQVLCTLKAWEDADYCKTRLGLDAPLGSIDRSKMNVKGSSLAAGHPFAATGGRIVANLAKLLSVAQEGRGLISICAAGGQGVTAILEK